MRENIIMGFGCLFYLISIELSMKRLFLFITTLGIISCFSLCALGAVPQDDEIVFDEGKISVSDDGPSFFFKIEIDPNDPMFAVPEWDASRFFSGDLENGDFCIGSFSRRDYSYYREQNMKWLYETTWRKDKYFDDPLVLELCDAMQNHDVPGMRRAIERGADVNARGKDNMPLLLWSVFLGEDVFETLLKEGADPDFVIENQYHIEDVPVVGRSLFREMISLSCVEDEKKPFFRRYASIMLKYGADPNYNNPSVYSLQATSREWAKGLWSILLDFGIDSRRVTTERLLYVIRRQSSGRPSL